MAARDLFVQGKEPSPKHFKNLAKNHVKTMGQQFKAMIAQLNNLKKPANPQNPQPGLSACMAEV